MAGSLDLFDSVQLTAASEYASRLGTDVDTLQIHHATTRSLSGLIGLMQPGGRTVSANGAMSNGGHLVEVVPLASRAFTSASGYDRRCLTVECCNTSLDPDWGISDATHERLARLAADMYRAGILGAISRKYIIGHREVPGTYPTACPGPSMDLDRIVARARELAEDTAPAAAPAGVAQTPVIPTADEEEDEMRPKFGHRSGTNEDEWMLVHPDLRGATDLEVGYIITKDEDEAVAWARAYKNGWAPKLVGGPESRYDFDLPRPEYIQMQAAVRRVAQAMRSGAA